MPKVPIPTQPHLSPPSHSGPSLAGRRDAMPARRAAWVLPAAFAAAAAVVWAAEASRRPAATAPPGPAPAAFGPATTSPAVPAALPEPVGSRFRLGRLASKGLDESSGIVASSAHPGVYWTHNDSGNPPELFAVTREGGAIRTYAVAAKNDDWEDIATDGQGRLLIADIGNNDHNRKRVFVHRLPEPDPTFPPATAGRRAAKEPPLRVEQTWTLTYPGEPFDAESLFVRGTTGYVISKLRNLKHAGLYAFDLDPAKPTQVLRLVGHLPIRYPVTGADLSPDGRRLAVITVGGPYLFDDVPDDLAKLADATPAHVFYTHVKMEGVCLVPEGLLATTEDRDVFLFRWKDFGVKEPATGPATRP
jgi:hypothetical protein